MSRTPLLALVAAVAMMAAAATVVLRGGEPASLPVYWEAPGFALVDQNGDSLRAGELRGTIWIASFVFTHCEDVCPLISARMANLRDALSDEGVLGSQVRLISFSVDPVRDTPDVLRGYAGAFGGSPPSEWAFLTGVPAAEMEQLVQSGFRLAMAHPAHEAHEHGVHEGGYQVMHSPRAVLVDRSGQVRGTYDVTDAEAVDRLATDLRLLMQGG